MIQKEAPFQLVSSLFLNHLLHPVPITPKNTLILRLILIIKGQLGVSTG